MGKAKKKITRISGAAVLAIAVVLALPMVVVQLPPVQHFLKDKIEQTCLAETGLELTISDVGVRPPLVLKLEGVSVRDTCREVFAGFARAYVDVSIRSIVRKQLVLSSLRLDSLFLVVNRNADGQYAVENMPTFAPDTISAGGQTLPFGVDEIEIVRSRVVLKEKDEEKPLLRDVYLCVSDIKAYSDSLTAKVEQIGLFDAERERKGSASFDFKQKGDTLSIADLTAYYGKSQASFDTIAVVLSDDEEIPEFFFVLNGLAVDEDELKLIDSRAFADTRFTLSGVFAGDGQRISAQDVKLRNNCATLLDADLTVRDYRDLDKAFFDVRLSRAETTLSDLAQMSGLTIADEQKLRSVGVLSFHGTAVGPMSKVAVDADFVSGVGNVDAQIVIERDSAGAIGVRGNVVSPNLVFSDVTDGLVGSTDFEAEVDVRFENQGLVYADIEAFGTKIEFNDYPYSNVMTHYRMAHDAYVAAVEIDDQNGHIVAAAGLDLAHEKAHVYTMLLVDSLRTTATNLTPQWPDACLTAHFQTKFDANTPDDTEGYFLLRDFSFSDSTRTAAFDSIRLDVSPIIDGERHLRLQSDMGHGHIHGNFLYKDVVSEVMRQIASSSGVLFTMPEREVPEHTTFVGEVEYYDIQRFTQFFVPELAVPDTLQIRSQIRASDHTAQIDFALDSVSYASVEVQGLTGRLISRGDSIGLRLNTNEMLLPIVGSVGQTEMRALMYNDSLTFLTRWNDGGEGRHAGEFRSGSIFSKVDDLLRVTTQIDSSEIYVNGLEWKMHSSSYAIDREKVVVDSFCVSQGAKMMGIDGQSSVENPDDELCLWMKGIQLENIIEETEDSKFAVAGNTDMCLRASHLFDNVRVVCDADIDEFYVDHDRLDHLDLWGDWELERQSVLFDLDIVSGGVPRSHGKGHYDLASSDFDLMFDIDSVSIGFLNFYLDGAVRDIVGTSTGWLRLHGDMPDIKIDAHLGVNRTDFVIKQTEVGYTFTGGDTIVISPTSVEFQDIRFVDKYGKEGVFSGNISHDMFTGLGLNIFFRMKEQLVFDVPIESSPTYYGTIFGDGLLHITGTTTNTHLDIQAKTCPNSKFYILPLEKEDIDETSYIKFVSKYDEQSLEIDLEDMLSSVTAHMDLDIRPDAQITIVVDRQTGNQMTVSGQGSLVLDVDRSGDLVIGGTYTIANGVYVFAFENIINKHFQINQGSTISWDGTGAYNALLNVAATYKVKAALYDLVGETASAVSSDLKRRVPVNCNLLLTDRLSDPTIKFKIEIPSSLNFSQYMFDQYVNSDEEMTRQAFSLLLTNRFYAVEENTSSSYSSSYATATASEMLSNQLSSIISQNKYNINLGINYRPGDEVTNEEYEMSFSTQLFDNKMIVMGSMGYGRDVSESGDGGSSLIGDFDVEYKLTKNGKLRAKAYSHSNNDVVYETSPTTQGVGLLYRDEFDTFGELFRKYWSIITGKRRRERKAAEKAAAEEAALSADEEEYDEEYESTQEQ